MEIIPLSSHHIDDLTPLINDYIRLMPPKWQLSTTQVAAILQASSIWDIHYRDDEPDHPWRWETETMCVVERDTALAAARYDQRYDDGIAAPSHIETRWLVGSAARPEALQLLIDRLITFEKMGAVSVKVNSRCDFGWGWGGVPTATTFINDLLQQNNFSIVQKWAVMTADLSLLSPDTFGTITPFHLRWSLDDLHHEWTVEAYDDNTPVGECQSWGIPLQFAACPAYTEWMEIEWLGVEDAYQRRGLGRGLLQEQMQFHRERGVNYLALFVDAANAPALALYESLGFQCEAECWGWGR
ncbi:MAG: GNAT family N-acetyltransferase [Anaerolineae bacterium]